MDKLEVRSRSTGAELVSVVLIWSVASFSLAGTASAFAPDPVHARIGPLTWLVAIVSDRPTTTLAAPRGQLDSVPGLLLAEAATRSALLRMIGDVRFPAPLIAMSRLVTDLIRRGPPFSFTT